MYLIDWNSFYKFGRAFLRFRPDTFVCRTCRTADLMQLAHCRPRALPFY